jgi:hypothetical protein
MAKRASEVEIAWPAPKLPLRSDVADPAELHWFHLGAGLGKRDRAAEVAVPRSTWNTVAAPLPAATGADLPAGLPVARRPRCQATPTWIADTVVIETDRVDSTAAVIHASRARRTMMHSTR